ELDRELCLTDLLVERELDLERRGVTVELLLLAGDVHRGDRVAFECRSEDPLRARLTHAAGRRRELPAQLGADPDPADAGLRVAPLCSSVQDEIDRRGASGGKVE